MDEYAKEAMKNCPGCKRKLPTDDEGFHIEDSGEILMWCNKIKYKELLG